MFAGSARKVMLKPTYGMKRLKERVGKERDPSGGGLARDFPSSEKQEDGTYMRQYRAKHGLTDGMRLGKEEFVDYLRKRREEDEKNRGRR